MGWLTKDIDLGKVISKEEVEIYFKFQGDIEFISANTSCGCSVPTWNSITKTLEVKFTPEQVPVHKEYENLFSFVKTIIVKYKENGEEKVDGLGIIGKAFNPKAEPKHEKTYNTKQYGTKIN